MPQVAPLGGDEEVEREIAVGTARAEPVRRLGRRVEQPQMRGDRAGFLRKPRLIESGAVEPALQCRRRQNLVDRHDPGAPDPGEEDVVGPTDGGRGGLGGRGGAGGAGDRGAPPGGGRGGSGAGGGPGGPVTARPSSGSTSTVTNDGQSPARQEKSTLHDDWSICVLRPNSVSTGCPERPLLFAPQSPQPSHTASLMTTLLTTGGNLPRLGSRRASAAHCWS